MFYTVVLGVHLSYTITKVTTENTYPIVGPFLLVKVSYPKQEALVNTHQFYTELQCKKSVLLISLATVKYHRLLPWKLNINK